MSARGGRTIAAGLPRVRELRAFVLVGCAAFAVHFTVVATLAPLGMPPLAANVVAFLVAFGVSYVGHSRLTFPSERRATSAALPRFLGVAVGGFALNETLYWALLRYTTLDYRLALLLVLGAVAVVTLVWSKYWAFADAR